MSNGYEQKRSIRIIETVFLKHEVISAEEHREGLEPRPDHCRPFSLCADDRGV